MSKFQIPAKPKNPDAQVPVERPAVDPLKLAQFAQGATTPLEPITVAKAPALETVSVNDPSRWPLMDNKRRGGTFVFNLRLTELENAQISYLLEHSGKLSKHEFCLQAVMDEVKKRLAALGH